MGEKISDKRDVSYENIMLIVLVMLLFVGSVLLCVKRSRPFKKITIVKNGIVEEFTLKEVEEQLKEKKRVDINSAGSDEITAIPGIGGVLAARIVEYRRGHGKITNENDLLNVEGIGPGKLDKIKEYVKV